MSNLPDPESSRRSVVCSPELSSMIIVVFAPKIGIPPLLTIANIFIAEVLLKSNLFCDDHTLVEIGCSSKLRCVDSIFITNRRLLVDVVDTV